MAKWHSADGDGGGNVAAVMLVDFIILISIPCLFQLSLENANSAPFLSKSFRISPFPSSWLVCLCFVIIIPNWPSQLLPLVWAPLGIGFSDRFFN